MVPIFFDISLTSAFTSAVERASSFAIVARFRPLSFFTSTSVAITFAPSATKACAMARPIPCPAAVTSAILPFSRPANSASLCGVQGRETLHLPAVFIEVRWIEPALEGCLARRPFAIEDRILRGVAILSLDHLMLAEEALELESVAQRSAFRRLVAVVAFPFEAPVAERKSVLAAEINGLGRGARALQARRIGDEAHFEYAVGGADLHQPEMAFRLAIGAVNDRKWHDVV